MPKPEFRHEEKDPLEADKRNDEEARFWAENEYDLPHEQRPPSLGKAESADNPSSGAASDEEIESRGASGPESDARSVSSPAGSPPYGSAKAGSARSSSARSGSARSGSARSVDAKSGDGKLDGGKPGGGKRSGDKPGDAKPGAGARKGRESTPPTRYNWHGDDLSDLDEDDEAPADRTRPAIRLGRVALVAAAGILVMLLVGDMLFAQPPTVPATNISAPRTIHLEAQDDPVKLQAPPPPPGGAEVAPSMPVPTGPHGTLAPPPAGSPAPHTRVPHAAAPPPPARRPAATPSARRPSPKATPRARPTKNNQVQPNRRPVNPPPPPRGGEPQRPAPTQPNNPPTNAPAPKPAAPPPPPPPALRASPGSLHIADRSSGSVTLTATGDVTWSVSGTGSVSIGVSPSSGSLSNGASTSLTLTAATSGYPSEVKCGAPYSSSVYVQWSGVNKGVRKSDNLSITLTNYRPC
ncbi:hypothetical protein [Sinosporangium siamense]|nr:hypothetical protein [Sinosporangium siamense]